MKFDWKKTIATVAPAIATALGTPLAGVAVHTAFKALGLEGDDEESALSAAVASGNPNVLVELRKAEQEFEIHLERIGVTLEELEVQKQKIAADSTEGARRLAVSKGTYTQNVLSALYTVGYFAMVIGLMAGKLNIPNGSTGGATLTLIGVMTKAQADILHFWFGSSLGSKQKTDAIAVK
ncbi:MAG: hypothetical protein AAGI88_09185 [Pseudomonadota bacterium]